MKRDKVKKKFPLGFGLVATFGFACMMQGVGGIIDKLDFLNRNPIITLLFGMGVLIITGGLYKKLDV